MDNKTGMESLIKAAEEGDSVTMESLIKSGTDVNGVDNVDNTALIKAAVNGMISL